MWAPNWRAPPTVWERRAEAVATGGSTLFVAARRKTQNGVSLDGVLLSCRAAGDSSMLVEHSYGRRNDGC